jgi:hypothetical protein
MSELLLCKECKYAKWRPWYLMLWRCTRVKVAETVKVDPVTGPVVTKAHYESCFSARYGDCGKDGKYWQPKHKKFLFKLIAKEHV